MGTVLGLTGYAHMGTTSWSIPPLPVIDTIETSPYWISTMSKTLSVQSEDNTRIVWNSSIDGDLGEGTVITVVNLSIGNHVISVIATYIYTGISAVASFPVEVVGVYGSDLTFDEKLDRWLILENKTLPDYYRKHLRTLSSGDRLAELRKRGCWSLI